MAAKISAYTTTTWVLWDGRHNQPVLFRAWDSEAAAEQFRTDMLTDAKRRRFTVRALQGTCLGVDW